MGGFGVHVYDFHLTDADIFLKLRLESLDKFVVSHNFAFESVMQNLVVLYLLNDIEVLFLVGFILFGRILVFVVGALEFLVHLNNVCFESY